MQAKRVWVSLSETKITELIAAGHLSGVDLHCHDPDVKNFIRQVCLKTCSQKSCLGCPMKSSCAHKVAETMVTALAFKYRVSNI